MLVAQGLTSHIVACWSCQETDLSGGGLCGNYSNKQNKNPASLRMTINRWGLSSTVHTHRKNIYLNVIMIILFFQNDEVSTRTEDNPIQCHAACLFEQ